jgi:hypothetical protein
VAERPLYNLIYKNEYQLLLKKKNNYNEVTVFCLHNPDCVGKIVKKLDQELSMTNLYHASTNASLNLILQQQRSPTRKYRCG